MELTIETISLVVISLTAIAIISAIFLSTISVNIEVLRPNAVVKVHDAEYFNGSTWFLLSVTFGDEITSVEISGPSGACNQIYKEAYTGRTWEVYGCCADDIRGEFLIVKVHSESSMAEVSVKV